MKVGITNNKNINWQERVIDVYFRTYTHTYPTHPYFTVDVLHYSIFSTPVFQDPDRVHMDLGCFYKCRGKNMLQREEDWKA